MDAEWSAECGAGAPVIEVPWSDALGANRFVDLRMHPERIVDMPEVIHWPELRNVLLLLNDKDQPFFTTKCDAWCLSEEERSRDFGLMPFGFGAYIDLVWREQVDSGSFEVQRRWAESFADRTRREGLVNAEVQIIIRHAVINGRHGFAFTLYVFGYGETEAEARCTWSEGLALTAKSIADGDTMMAAGE